MKPEFMTVLKRIPNVTYTAEKLIKVIYVLYSYYNKSYSYKCTVP